MHKERPILFSGEMVRAILEGRKTQTRRVINPQPRFDRAGMTDAAWAQDETGRWCFPNAAPELRRFCPYGVPGDRLWVRETLRRDTHANVWYYAASTPEDWVVVSPERHTASLVWAVHKERDVCVSIHMPRWASRITLEITDVRVERVREISEEDAIAEGTLQQVGDGWGPGAGYKWSGIGYHGAGFTKDGARTFHVAGANGKCGCNAHGKTPAQCAFRELWDSINGKRGFGWDANPWVWAITFKVIDHA